MKNRFKNYFAEFLGTMCLVLFGCGTSMAVGINAKQGSGYILTAVAFGLVLAVMSYSICKKSGCHVNPAVSLAMLVLRKLRLVDFFGYIVAQFAGSFLACGLLFAIFYGHTGKYGANVSTSSPGSVTQRTACAIAAAAPLVGKICSGL